MSDENARVKELETRVRELEGEVAALRDALKGSRPTFAAVRDRLTPRATFGAVAGGDAYYNDRAPNVATSDGWPEGHRYFKSAESTCEPEPDVGGWRPWFTDV